MESHLKLCRYDNQFVYIQKLFPHCSLPVCVCMLSHVRLVATWWTVARQAPLSMEFSKQEILEWVAISFSRGSSVPRSPICISWVSCISRQILYHLYHLGRHFHYLHSLKKNLPPLSLFHVLYYLSFWIAKRWAECNLVQVFRILHPPPKKKSWIHHLCTFTVLKF